jgi:hypothetical protein
VRMARLVLCDADERVLGALPVFPVEVEHWPEVAPLAAGARALGAAVTVLRLLAVDDPLDGPLTTTHLAEVAGGGAGLPLDRDDLPVLGDEPLRASWARPGGVAELVRWAVAELDARGVRVTGSPELVRSWNLSALVRLETSDGVVWCKAVPPFFAHEGEALALLHASGVPRLPPLLAHERGRVLLAHVPGRDAWDGAAEVAVPLVRWLVDAQVRVAGALPALLAAGAPDWRATSLTRLCADLAAHPETQKALTPAERSDLAALVAELPDRFSALAACGLPDGLVHGDLHTGNVRAAARSMVVLDWGDSGVGHVLLDEAALLERLDERTTAQVRAAWVEAWAQQRPDADAAGAMALVRPIAALRQALIYRVFLDGIEPAERLYHADNVPLWLRRALALR